MRLLRIATFPLRRTADVVDASSAVLSRTAGVLRFVARAGGPSGSTPSEDAPARSGSGPDSGSGSGAATKAPAGRATKAAGGSTGSQSDEHTAGRTAAERREPTPEPAQDTSARQAAGQRRASTPKAARKGRQRSARAASITTVGSEPGSGHGGAPANVRAENTPTERAAAKAGREPAPMGSEEPPSES